MYQWCLALVSWIGFIDRRLPVPRSEQGLWLLIIVLEVMDRVLSKNYPFYLVCKQVKALFYSRTLDELFFTEVVEQI